MSVSMSVRYCASLQRQFEVCRVASCHKLTCVSSKIIHHLFLSAQWRISVSCSICWCIQCCICCYTSVLHPKMACLGVFIWSATWLPRSALNLHMYVYMYCYIRAYVCICNSLPALPLRVNPKRKFYKINSANAGRTSHFKGRFKHTHIFFLTVKCFLFLCGEIFLFDYTLWYYIYIYINDGSTFTIYFYVLLSDCVAQMLQQMVIDVVVEGIQMMDSVFFFFKYFMVRKIYSNYYSCILVTCGPWIFFIKGIVRPQYTRELHF